MKSGVVEVLIGIKAEGQPLESFTPPLTAAPASTSDVTSAADA